MLKSAKLPHACYGSVVDNLQDVQRGFVSDWLCLRLVQDCTISVTLCSSALRLHGNEADWVLACT